MRPKLLVAIAIFALVASFLARSSGADALDQVIPAPAVDTPTTQAKPTEVAVLAGGCFWGMQGMFQHVDGVTKVLAGYSGGDRATATYDQVTTERTGHAEAVEITFDPRKVSYGQLLRLYFSVAHDPTQLNRQGPDRGPSYRSQIFFASPSQERVARAYMAQLEKSGIFDNPIVTKVEPLKAFYAAEGYHQDFLIHNPTHPYIVRNDLPKVAALERLYPQMYRDQPVLAGRR
jgi:peptide-methionine (S)-S-oxide reductase